MTDYEVLEDAAGLDGAAAALAHGSGPVAVDVERASGYRYSQRAYLVQVRRDGAGTFLFDPPAIGDFTALQQAIGGEEWVLHAASQDLPSLHELGLSPRDVFDTELAARLLGHERVGLGAVVEDVLGITLAKEHSAADWSTRPLPQSWLEYAALDVEYLVPVRDALAVELREAGKAAFAAAEFAAERDMPPKPPRAEPWRRMSGLHSLRGARALAVARELWTARDELAQAEDVSPGRLVPDRSLVAAVKAEPRTRSALAALKEFTGRASRTRLDVWWGAIVRGRAREDLPALRAAGDGPPPVRAWKQRHPDAFRRHAFAHAAVAEHAETLRMPLENLLSPRLLRQVCWEPPADEDATAARLREFGAREWQVTECAPLIAAAFVRSLQPDAQAVPAAS